MSMWKRLLSGLRGAAAALDRPEQPAEPVKLQGPGRFRVEVVGESHYKDAFLTLLGDRAYTDDEIECEARLVPLANNPHDRNAVGVFINGLQVGHLTREYAPAFREFLRQQNLQSHRALRADARIYAGDDRGMFSVSLDL